MDMSSQGSHDFVITCLKDRKKMDDGVAMLGLIVICYDHKDRLLATVLQQFKHHLKMCSVLSHC